MALPQSPPVAGNNTGKHQNDDLNNHDLNPTYRVPTTGPIMGYRQ
jgi:hypothetical protein